MRKAMVIGTMALLIAFGATGCATPKAVKEDVVNTVSTVKGAATDAADAVGDAVEKVMPKKLDLNGKGLWKKGGDIKGL